MVQANPRRAPSRGCIWSPGMSRLPERAVAIWALFQRLRRVCWHKKGLLPD